MYDVVAKKFTFAISSPDELLYVYVAYGHGSVLLGHGYEIPRGRGSFGVFSPLTMRAKYDLRLPCCSCNVYLQQVELCIRAVR